LGQPGAAGVVIQDVTATAFRLTVTLNAGGVWRIQVENPDGLRSNSSSFAVQAGPFPAPAVESVTRSTSGASYDSQTLWVMGSGLLNGLTVSIVNPLGAVQELSGPSVTFAGEGTL
jgi:hypothetical protein